MEKKKVTIEEVKQWCVDHKKQLIIGGSVTVAAIVAFLIFKKCNAEIAALEKTSEECAESLMGIIEGKPQLARDICEEVAMNRPKIPHELDDFMWYVCDKTINAPFDIPEGCTNAALLAGMEDHFRKILDTLPIEDIKLIQVMIDV